MEQSSILGPYPLQRLTSSDVFWQFVDDLEAASGKVNEVGYLKYHLYQSVINRFWENNRYL